MTASMRIPLPCLLALALFASSVLGAPGEDLLPPPVRHVEKRAFAHTDPRYQRRYYNGRQLEGAAFSPDGKLLLAGNLYQGISLWDVGAGREIGQLNLQNTNNGAAFAFLPDGKRFVVATWNLNGGMQNYPVSLWDVARRERLRSLDEDVNDTPFSALTLSPDGKTIALGGGGANGRRTTEPAVSFWDLESGDEVGRLGGLIAVEPARRGMSSFLALAYSPDGRTLAVLVEGQLLLVEVATNKVREQFAIGGVPGNRQEQIHMGMQQEPLAGALAYAPNGRMLAVGCPDGVIRHFDLTTGQELAPWSGNTSGIAALCWTPDGKAVHSYTAEGQFFVWRVEPGHEWTPRTGPLSDDALETLWQALRSDDALDQFGCVETFAANPEQAVHFLRSRVAPVPKAEGEQIEKLIADLQKGDYNTRKKSVLQLRKLGPAAAPAIQRAQQRGGYDELLQRLMLEFSSQSPPTEQVRAGHAVTALERIANADARRLLQQLAEGAPDAPLTNQAKSALDRLSKAAPVKNETSPDALWEMLARDDSAPAYRAIRRLAAQPENAPLLRQRLKELASRDTFDNDPARVAKLIAELDSNEFDLRESATKSLRNLGRLAVPALRKALDTGPAPEAKRRLEQLLEEAGKATASPEILRIGRCLEVLELMGGPEARRALEAIAKDSHQEWVRQAANAAVRRQEQLSR